MEAVYNLYVVYDVNGDRSLTHIKSAEQRTIIIGQYGDWHTAVDGGRPLRYDTIVCI